ncbi:MAG: hypothetical protein A2Z81_02805 [Omnitrophica WOR_2 bacterium GWA2_45_18]|nr:MAG: hypothetical protein A2Z81_02805 [Omnitrophica WOR_2 bacterium GWA2_45_18]
MAIKKKTRKIPKPLKIKKISKIKESKPEKTVLSAKAKSSDTVAIDVNLLGVGLDIGTANIVAAREINKGVEVEHSHNAFLYIRTDEGTSELLARMKIPKHMVKERPCVLGKNAFDFSNYFDRTTQRPMNVGVINPLERDAIHIVNMIVDSILWKPRVPNEICCFCVPAQPVDSNTDIFYHRNVAETMLSVFGFKAMPMNEAFAIILSELKEKKFTGIGVSCGGGMTNICVSYKAVSILEFSVARGGDWIDAHASQVLDISANKVALIKEKGMSILKPETREQEAIALFYKKYINYFLTQIAKVFHAPDKSPQFEEPIDMVFAGGSTMIGGFMEVVRQELKSIDLGVPISEARKAVEPFFCVAKGCLYNAQQMNKQAKAASK